MKTRQFYATLTAAALAMILLAASFAHAGWSVPGTGIDSSVQALVFDSTDNLYAGGTFSAAGGVSANNIAKWDGTAWAPLGTGMDHSVQALASDSAGNLYAGGHFTTAGGVSANYVARWDGSAWSALGSGMNDILSFYHVKALACDSAGNLYAGGNFTTAGGVSANYVAKWDGSAWSALGPGRNPVPEHPARLSR
ncbi:MAG: hypothetical protein DRI57_31365 [Deltaproteobacteria bacterium]|nr:MAG: hypothetical protein DRI57_31365 [Deltaproteobacteria bacterium]